MGDVILKDGVARSRPSLERGLIHSRVMGAYAFSGAFSKHELHVKLVVDCAPTLPGLHVKGWGTLFVHLSPTSLNPITGPVIYRSPRSVGVLNGYVLQITLTSNAYDYACTPIYLPPLFGCHTYRRPIEVFGDFRFPLTI